MPSRSPRGLLRRDQRDGNSTGGPCSTPRTAPYPRVLVIVPGHGLPERSHVVHRNLERMAAMRIITTCVMFIYGLKLDNATLAVRFPSCRLTWQQGYWMHHLRAVRTADVDAHDFVLLMIDGVEMNPE